MTEFGWKGNRVRDIDGRTGVICDEWAGFMHLAIQIRCADGATDIVQLNSNGADSGATGWQWLCLNFNGGPHWLPLGDHSGCEVEPAPEERQVVAGEGN